MKAKLDYEALKRSIIEKNEVWSDLKRIIFKNHYDDPGKEKKRYWNKFEDLLDKANKELNEL